MEIGLLELALVDLVQLGVIRGEPLRWSFSM